jgi:outer membrane protein assembly factor BamB
LKVFDEGICWSWRNSVVLRDRASGRLLWEQRLPVAGPLSAPVQQDGEIFVASARGLCALDPGDGRVLCRHGEFVECGGGLPGIPLLESGDERLFVLSRGRGGRAALRCVRTGDNTVIWERAMRNVVRIRKSGGQLFVRSDHLVALDTVTGEPIWEAAIGGCGELAVDAKSVYAVDAESHARLMALDRMSGRQLWDRLVAASCNGVVVRGDRAFLSGNDGYLRAFLLAPDVQRAAEDTT